MDLTKTRMDLGFLIRVQKATLAVAAVGFVLLASYYEFQFASGFFVGALWGVGNFWALGMLLRAVVTPDQINRRRAYILAAVKFPILYVAGYFILTSNWFTPVSLLTGFSLLFLVVVLKAAGRLVMGMDNRSTTSPKVAVK